MRPLRNGAFIEDARGSARAALLIDNYSYTALVCRCRDLQEPKLVLCTSLQHAGCLVLAAPLSPAYPVQVGGTMPFIIQHRPTQANMGR